MAKRMAEIRTQIEDYEAQYAASHNESEKRHFQKEMSKLTTEYLRLLTK